MFKSRPASSEMNRIRPQLIVYLIYLYFGLLILAFGYAGAQPSFLLPQANEIVDDTTHKSSTPSGGGQQAGADLAGFRQFIDSGNNRDSQVIGQLKSNNSASELLALKENIAKAISDMQAKERQRGESVSNNNKPQESVAECFIELTRVEKIPGKCKRVKGGQPVCESNQLMSFARECN